MGACDFIPLNIEGHASAFRVILSVRCSVIGRERLDTGKLPLVMNDQLFLVPKRRLPGRTWGSYNKALDS